MGKRFKGRVAVVTGAGGGLGRATAKALAAEGASLVLLDRDGGELAITANDCSGALTLVGDVTTRKVFDEAARLAKENFGPVELLAAAAGILGPAKPAVDLDEDTWDRLFDINVKGAWLAVRAFVPHMRELGRGSIVLFSSTSGLIGSPLFPAYSATKGAITLLTRSLALNHAGENIRVNCVCPGTIDTPMLARTIEEAGDEDAQRERAALMRNKHPLKRFGLPHEVAAAVLYVLSDDASFTTGIALPVDGGRLA